MRLMIDKIKMGVRLPVATSMTIGVLALALVCAMPTRANELTELRLFCSSKCHRVFEQTVTDYVMTRYAEEEERRQSQSARKKIRIVVDYHFPGGDSINIFHPDSTKYSRTVLYKEVVKGQPGCWRVKKYDSVAETIYVANFAFNRFTALSANDLNCLRLMVIDATSQ
jgi:hypothetical protein